MKFITPLFSKKHRVKSAIVVVVLLVVGFLIYRSISTQQKKPTYQTTTAVKDTLIVTLTASGQVTSTNNAPVNTQTSGVVAKLYVKNGDTVQAGQKIADISPDLDGKAKKAAAYASYLSAVSGLKSAQQSKMSADAQMWKDQQSVLLQQDTVNNRNGNNINPATKLLYTDLQFQSVDSGMVNANKQFLASETKYKEADFAVAAAQAALTAASLSNQQSSSTIVAPIAGVVDGLSLENGQVIAPSTTTQKVATIKTTARPMVTINLTEIDVPKVKIGNLATLTFDAFSGKTFTGRIVSIDSSGVVSSGVTTYPTVIQLETDVPGLYANMSATAKVITLTKNNVVLVPSGAIQTVNGQTQVRILKNGQPQTVPVEVGVASDTQTEITSGVADGDAVITGSSVSSSTTGTQTSGTSPFSRTFGGGGGGGGVRALTGGRGG